MKTNAYPRRTVGFTLVELLVVIGIIAILAGMLLPVLAIAHTKALVARAKTEESSLVQAIEGYDSAYGRFPSAEPAGTNDMTFGGKIILDQAGTPSSPLSQIGSQRPGVNPGTILSNDEVMAILLDDTNSIYNTNHIRNPQQTVFGNVHHTSETNTPGLGPDGMYRDPWGNPYIITMDLNYDERTKDIVYAKSVVSKDNGNTGLNGLIDPSDPTGNNDDFEFRGKVMVWSVGPDKKANDTIAGNKGENKDNVFSWK